MNLADYISRVQDGFEFLIAVVSLIGFLGLIFGVLMLLIGNGRSKNTGIRLILISILLVALTGLFTGVKYFRI